MSDDIGEVTSLVLSLNRAWLEGRYDELHRFFHEDVVLAHPGFNQRTVGREALIQTELSGE